MRGLWLVSVSMLGAAGAGKVCGGCGRVYVNLQETQKNAPSVLCGAAR